MKELVKKFIVGVQHLLYKMQYKKPADPDKVIEIHLSEIKYYLTGNKHIKDRYDYQLI